MVVLLGVVPQKVDDQKVAVVVVVVTVALSGAVPQKVDDPRVQLVVVVLIVLVVSIVKMLLLAWYESDFVP